MATFDDIPGTFVFDGENSRKGYHLNMFMMSLVEPDNRDAFKADERGYIDRFPMTEDQKRSILDRDWNRMLELGGNVYYTLKLAATDGMPIDLCYAEMAGMSREDFRAMMLAGGRPPEGNLYVKDWEAK